MEITLKGHTYEDAVRQVLQLFFALNSDISVCSSLYENGDTLTASASVSVNGRQYEASVEKEGITLKREVQDLIKKSVFSSCRKLSDMPAPWGVSTGIRPAKTAREMLENGASKEEIIKYMQDEFWMTPEKARLSEEVAERERVILDNRLENGISLYVGIPFCPTRCAYCSFISQATNYNDKFMLPYVEALIKEIHHSAKLSEKYNMQPETVYFGGGTPTVLSPESLDLILTELEKAFDLSRIKEFTVEAGRPDTFTRERLSVLKEHNVDRISINPQTMEQKTLDLIGRRHTVEETVRAFEMAKSFDCFSINADLIAGLPEESQTDFENTLESLLRLEPDAVTVHTMYLKRAARMIDDFEKYRFASSAGDMVAYSYNTLKENGYFPYYMYKQKNTLGNLENVGYAKEGHECLYNIYIMEEVHTVLAMGAGASTKTVDKTRIERSFNPKEAADYIRRIDEVLERKTNCLKNNV